MKVKYYWRKRKLFWSAIERDKLRYVTHLFVHEKLSHGRITDWKRMRKRHLNIIMATQKNNERMFCHMFCAHEITKLSRIFFAIWHLFLFAFNNLFWKSHKITGFWVRRTSYNHADAHDVLKLFIIKYRLLNVILNSF